jgi:4-carboxymuconolactone decarboxylase
VARAFEITIAPNFLQQPAILYCKEVKCLCAELRRGDMMPESRFDVGMKVRKEVLGREYVEQAMSRTTEFDADFQHYITEAAWGSVWARPDLDRRTRSLVTIAILAALGREELVVHLRASRTIEVDPHEIAEVLLHVAVYAGVPAANAAFKVAKNVFEHSTRDAEEEGSTKASQEDA